MDNAGTWDSVAPMLPKNLSLVAVDFPSHGLSSPRPLGNSSHMMDMVLILERIVRHFGWKEVSKSVIFITIDNTVHRFPSDLEQLVYKRFVNSVNPVYGTCKVHTQGNDSLILETLPGSLTTL